MFFLLISGQGVFLHVIHAFFFFYFVNVKLILQCKRGYYLPLESVPFFFFF